MVRYNPFSLLFSDEGRRSKYLEGTLDWIDRVYSFLMGKNTFTPNAPHVHLGLLDYLLVLPAIYFIHMRSVGAANRVPLDPLFNMLRDFVVGFYDFIYWAGKMLLLAALMLPSILLLSPLRLYFVWKGEKLKETVLNATVFPLEEKGTNIEKSYSLHGLCEEKNIDMQGIFSPQKLRYPRYVNRYRAFFVARKEGCHQVELYNNEAEYKYRIPDSPQAPLLAIPVCKRNKSAIEAMVRLRRKDISSISDTIAETPDAKATVVRLVDHLNDPHAFVRNEQVKEAAEAHFPSVLADMIADYAAPNFVIEPPAEAVLPRLVRRRSI